MVYYRYQEAQARRAIQLYYISLAIADKDRLYKEFRKPNLEIRILLSSNALTYGADIPDINYVAQYCMHKDKSINIIWQRLGRGTHSSG